LKKTFTKSIKHSKQNQFLKFTQDLCNKFSSQSSRQFNTKESKHNELDITFSKILDEKYHSYLGDSGSLVKRLGLMTYKSAMVLSGIRTDEPIIECEDVDFDTAMKLTKVYLAHGLNVFEKINNRENRLPLNEERWMNKLPKEFTTGEAITIAKKLGIAERTVYKKLSDYVKSELLKKVKTAVYRKLSKN
jgi:arsenate reductase-like glutaredoxin family protein